MVLGSTVFSTFARLISFFRKPVHLWLRHHLKLALISRLFLLRHRSIRVFIPRALLYFPIISFFSGLLFRLLGGRLWPWWLIGFARNSIVSDMFLLILPSATIFPSSALSRRSWRNLVDWGGQAICIFLCVFSYHRQVLTTIVLLLFITLIFDWNRL